VLCGFDTKLILLWDSLYIYLPEKMKALTGKSKLLKTKQNPEKELINIRCFFVCNNETLHHLIQY
jgi:hypothetical protein